MLDVDELLSGRYSFCLTLQSTLCIYPCDTVRYNQSIQMRYFPGWSLLLIGIVMCIPSGVWTANTVEQGAAANP